MRPWALPHLVFCILVISRDDSVCGKSSSNLINLLDISAKKVSSPRGRTPSSVLNFHLDGRVFFYWIYKSSKVTSELFLTLVIRNICQGLPYLGQKIFVEAL